MNLTKQASCLLLNFTNQNFTSTKNFQNFKFYCLFFLISLLFPNLSSSSVLFFFYNLPLFFYILTNTCSYHRHKYSNYGIKEYYKRKGPRYIQYSLRHLFEQKAISATKCNKNKHTSTRDINTESIRPKLNRN